LTLTMDPILDDNLKRRKRKRQSRRFSFRLYQLLYGPIVFVKAAFRQLILVVAMFIVGTAIFSYYEHLPLISALLASVSTITTIGLYVPNGGNFFTMDPEEAVLLIFMIIISVGAAASLLQSSFDLLRDGDLAKGAAEERMIKRLKGHAIIMGYSHLGRYVAEKLDELGFDNAIVTRDPSIYHDLLKRNVFTVLENENHPIKALKEAGLDKAAIIIAAQDEDSRNMLIILAVRKLRPDIRIVSVINDQDLVETARSAGADVIIPSSVTVGRLLALSAVTKNLVGVVFSEKIGTKEIAEFSIFKTSKLIGKGLHEVSKYATIIGVVRDDAVVSSVFDPTFNIRENDILLVLGDSARLEKLEKEAKAI
jgi:Trk K+ transport system NAD-binding subunit